MLVLKTVAEHQRRRRRWWVSALSLISLLLLAPAAWWMLRPGIPVDHALGLELPPGTRLLHSESRDEGSYRAVYLATTRSVEEHEERFSALAVETRPASHRFVLRDGTVVIVAQPYDIPSTRMMPVREVSAGVPLGVRSWLVFLKGELPESTRAISVPPLGES